MAVSPSTAVPRQAPPERLLALAAADHLPIGPVPVFNGDLAEATQRCLEWIDGGIGGRVATANLDFVALARQDAELKRLLGDSHLVVADGAPVAWLARVAGGERTRRVGGVDLVAALLEAGERRGGLRVALYGGAPEVAADARQAIERRYEHVNVVAAISPPFREQLPEEEELDRRALRSVQPDLVLVALGCPKQEVFIGRFYEAAPQAIWVGVGGTLDFMAGRKRRAPQALQSLGLEWAVRFAQEPRRLWRRYVLRDMPALIAVAPGCLAMGARRFFRRSSGR